MGPLLVLGALLVAGGGVAAVAATKKPAGAAPAASTAASAVYVAPGAAAMTFSIPNAPHVVHLQFPGGSWQPMTATAIYPVNTYVRAQLPTMTAANGAAFVTSLQQQIANNTFGADSVTVYPPGVAGPIDWPGGATNGMGNYRLDFYTQRAGATGGFLLAMGATAWAHT